MNFFSYICELLLARKKSFIKIYTHSNQVKSNVEIFIFQ